MKIKAAVIREKAGPFLFEEHELEAPREDEVLVRVHSTGICHTDLAVRDGHLPVPFPIILGHEAAGIVERVGCAVTELVPGDHVVLTAESCGACAMCCSGHAPYCRDVRQLNISGCRGDGSTRIVDEEGLRAAFFGQSSFATYALASERNAVKVPADLDLALLGQLGCGIQTGAGAVVNRLKPTPGSTLLICGAGPVGIAAAMAAKIVGCSVIAVLERHGQRLRAVAELGATHVVDGSLETDPFDRLREIEPEGFDGVIDTTGSPQIIGKALNLLKPMQACVLLAPGPTITLPLSPLISGGRTVSGHSSGHISSKLFLPRMIDWYRQGIFPLDRIVRRYPFDQLNEACLAAEAGEVIKPVVVMPGFA